MRSFATKSRLYRRAFTLVEILVAMAVLVFLIALLSKMLSTAQLSVRNLQGSALRRQDAGSVLAIMSDDLRSSLHPMNTSFEMADPATAQFQLLINPPGVSGSTVRNATTIFWGTATGSTKGGSSLTGYVLRWGLSASGKPQPLLCRVFLGSATTQPQLVSLQSGSPTAAGLPVPAPKEWATTAFVNSYAPADATNGYLGYLADNIIALYVRALDPEMKPIVTFPRAITGASWANQGGQDYYIGLRKVNLATATTGVLIKSQSTIAQYDSRIGYQYTRTSDGKVIDCFGPRLPAAIELIVVAASPREISRLKTPVGASTSGDPAAIWTDVNSFVNSLTPPLRKTARIYSTIVPL